MGYFWPIKYGVTILKIKSSVRTVPKSIFTACFPIKASPAEARRGWVGLRSQNRVKRFLFSLGVLTVNWVVRNHKNSKNNFPQWVQPPKYGENTQNHKKSTNIGFTRVSSVINPELPNIGGFLLFLADFSENQLIFGLLVLRAHWIFFDDFCTYLERWTGVFQKTKQIQNRRSNAEDTDPNSGTGRVKMVILVILARPPVIRTQPPEPRVG